MIREEVLDVDQSWVDIADAVDKLVEVELRMIAWLRGKGLTEQQDLVLAVRESELLALAPAKRSA